MTDHQERAKNERQLDAQLSGIARLGMLTMHTTATDYPDQLERHIEQREEIEREGILSIEPDRVLRIVLCTGGPHAEIVWRDGHNPRARCFGWFGAGEVERSLTDEEQQGLWQILGDCDFDEAWQIYGQTEAR